MPTIIAPINAICVGATTTSDDNWHGAQTWGAQNLGGNGVLNGSVRVIARCADPDAIAIWDMPKVFKVTDEGMTLAGEIVPPPGNIIPAALSDCAVGYVIDGFDFTILVKGLIDTEIDWVVEYDLKLAFRDDSEEAFLRHDLSSSGQTTPIKSLLKKAQAK